VSGVRLVARMLRLILSIWFLALVLLFAPFLAQGEDPTSSQLKIGVILPLSGGASNLGAIVRRGVELALDDISPEDRRRVSVVYEDDALTNARSATAARKLLTIDKVDALMTFSSGSGLTVASIAEKKGVPHLSIASDPAVAKSGSYSFTYWPLVEDEVEVLTRHLVATKVKKVAIISQVHNGALALRDEFVRRAVKDRLILVVADEEVSGDMSDFRSVLERIKRKGDFQGFIPILFPGPLAVCLKQARSIGIPAPFFGFETFEDKDEIKSAGSAMVGAVYATGSEPTDEFTKKYQAKYPGESFMYASHSYDIVRLFVDATREKKDGASVLAFLHSVKDRQTASGVVNVTSGNQFRLPVALREIDGRGGSVRLN
jgi:branched-chain amino acid transport system substrate-binding protein